MPEITVSKQKSNLVLDSLIADISYIEELNLKNHNQLSRIGSQTSARQTETYPLVKTTLVLYKLNECLL